MSESFPIEITPVEMQILTYLREDQGLSRNDLADRLHLSRSKTSQHISDLVQRRLVKDDIIGESSGGRKPKLINIDGSFCTVIGIYMGTTSATIGIGNFKGEILFTHRHVFLSKSMPSEILDAVIQQIFKLLDTHQIKQENIYAIGIGVPAPIDRESGLVISPANMLNWENFSVADHFSCHFSNATIQVDNDANIMALGEIYHGIGKGHKNCIYTKIGTGIGCGIICNGEIYRGSNGTAGDIGHVSVDRNGPVCYCGNIGCLEKLAAAPAIVDKALKCVHNGDSPALTALYNQRGQTLIPEDIGTAAIEGDKVANEIITQSGRTIGRVLATLVGFFNPSIVMIGGGLSDIGPQFVTSIHRTILDYSQPLSTRNLDVRKSDMGHTAGVYGALNLGINAIFRTSYKK